MLRYVYHGLESFQSVFSCHRSWLLFAAVVLSFLAAPEMIGVTSMCRFWLGDERVYHRLLHFFRSKAYGYGELLDAWQRYVLSQAVAVELKGRCVLLGDHTHVVKDGGRMPRVVSLRETSETQHKPSYFRGQCWGAVGLVVGSLRACFCSPLEFRIHQGLCHRGEGQPGAARPGPSLAERVVHMALRFAVGHDRPAFLVLDAFFSTAGVFRLARAVYSLVLKQPYLMVLARAKKNYVAYFPAEPKPPGRRGPQPRYGDKVYLMECFDHPQLFQTAQCHVYSKLEAVQLMSLPLLWKPLGDWLLFIFAITSRGPIVLMSSDLTLSATTAIELYCVRSRIELVINRMKSVLAIDKLRARENSTLAELYLQGKLLYTWVLEKRARRRCGEHWNRLDQPRRATPWRVWQLLRQELAVTISGVCHWDLRRWQACLEVIQERPPSVNSKPYRRGSTASSPTARPMGSVTYERRGLKLARMLALPGGRAGIGSALPRPIK